MAASLIAIATVSVAVPAYAQAPNDKAYLISLITPNNTQDGITQYTTQTASLMKKHRGKYVVPAIKVEEELLNDYLPSVYSAFPSRYVTIAAFDNSDALGAFLSSAKQHFASWSNRLENTIRFSAAVMPSPNSDMIFPVIGEAQWRPEPAFILLNASSFKKLPETPQYIGKYGSATPVVVGQGTRFLATFAKTGDVTGNYPHDILFLSEWASDEAFKAVHDAPEWRAVVPFRNFALASFTEAKGVIQ